MRSPFLFLLVASLHTVARAQTTWYVDGANCDGPGTGAIDAPFCTLQEAVDAAANGDTVKMSPGVYLEDVTIPELCLVVLGTGGPHETEIESLGSAAITLQPGSAVRLEGLTLSRAGIRCVQAAAEIRDCRFVATFQYMGGGLWADLSDVTMANCQFDGAAAGYGGAIATLGGTLQVTDSAFVPHSTSWPIYGGAVLLEGTDAVFSGCSFVGYSVEHSGSAIRIEGGSLALEHSFFHDNFVFDFGGTVTILDADVEIRDCDFFGNQSSLGWGGAIYVQSGPGFEASITDSVFEKNSAAEGGAVCVHEGILTLDRCQFLGNTTAAGNYNEHGYGGGLLVGGLGKPGAGAATARRCVFVGNSALGHRFQGDGRGGGVHGPVQLENCTLFRNRVGGFFGDGPVGRAASGGAVLHNCIVWDKLRNVLSRFDRPVQPDLLEPGTVANWSDVQGGWPGTGNMALDPGFRNRGIWGDYDLRSSSPCIDSGDPTQQDKDGSRIDIGAHAFDQGSGFARRAPAPL